MTPYLERRILKEAQAHGYTRNISPRAPNTFTDLAAQGLNHLVVYDGASADTIYSSPEVNYQLRYWHDRVHLLLGLSFSLTDEITVSAYQCSRLHDEGAQRILDADLRGQVEYYYQHKKYVDNQRDFVVGLLNSQNR